MRIIHIISFLLISVFCQAQSSIADLAKKAEIEKNPLHKYSNVLPFQNGLADVALYGDDGTKHGVADEEGNEYIPLVYDFIDLAKEGSGYKDNVYRCIVNGLYGLVNSQNTTLLPCEYTGIRNIKGDIWEVRKNGKYGYVQLVGTQSVKTKIPCIYSSIAKYTDDKPMLATLKGKQGLVDSNNNTVVPFEFDRIGDFNGNVWVKKDAQYGLYDKDGQMLQPCEITEAYTLSSTGEKRRIDFEDNPTLSDSHVFIVCGGKTGVIDGNSGNTLLPCMYEYLSPIINGELFYRSNGKWGIVGQDNRTVQQVVYDKVEVNKESLSETHIPNGLLRYNMHVSTNGVWGMLRRDGTGLIPVKYDSLGIYSENMIVAKKAGKYGYIDDGGKEAIPFVYFGADNFSEGLASVKNEKGKYLFVNKTGEIVIKPHEYDKVDKFTNGTCKVYRKDKVWEIDKEGKKVKDSKRDVSEDDAADGA